MRRGAGSLCMGPTVPRKRALGVQGEVETSLLIWVWGWAGNCAPNPALVGKEQVFMWESVVPLVHAFPSIRVQSSTGCWAV